MEKLTLKVAWPVDIYSDIRQDWAEFLKWTVQSLPHRQLEIYPIYVLSPNSMHWMGPVYKNEIDLVKNVVEESFDRYIATLKPMNVHRPITLTGLYRNKKQEVTALNDYLRSNDFDLVIMSTHARKGLNRWLMGSFAETYIGDVIKPTLFFSSHMTLPNSLRNCFIPTDLSEDSKAATLAFLKAQFVPEAQIELFTVFTINSALLDTSMAASGAGWATYYKLVEEKEKLVEKESNDLLAKISALGYRAHSSTAKTESSVAQAVLDRAKKWHAELIVLSCQTGPREAFFLGSIARQLLRETEMPVLVMPTK